MIFASAPYRHVQYLVVLSRVLHLSHCCNCWFLITILLSNSVLSGPEYHCTTVGCAVHSTWHKRDVIFKLCTFFSINYCEMTIISENWYCFRCAVNQILQQICWLCCLPQEYLTSTGRPRHSQKRLMPSHIHILKHLSISSGICTGQFTEGKVVIFHGSLHFKLTVEAKYTVCIKVKWNSQMIRLER